MATKTKSKNTKKRVTSASMKKDVAKTAKVTQEQAREVINAYVETIGKELKSGKRVTINGLGTISKTEIPMHMGYDLEKGKKAYIKKYSRLSIAASETLKKSL